MTDTPIKLVPHTVADRTDNQEAIIALCRDLLIAAEAGTILDLAVVYGAMNGATITHIRYADFTRLAGAVAILQHDVMHTNAGEDTSPPKDES